LLAPVVEQNMLCQLEKAYKAFSPLFARIVVLSGDVNLLYEQAQLSKEITLKKTK